MSQRLVAHSPRRKAGQSQYTGHFPPVLQTLSQPSLLISDFSQLCCPSSNHTNEPVNDYMYDNSECFEPHASKLYTDLVQEMAGFSIPDFGSKGTLKAWPFL